MCKELLTAFNEINWNVVDANPDLEQACRLIGDSMNEWQRHGVKSGYYEKFRQLMEKAYDGTRNNLYKEIAEKCYEY